MGFFLSWNCAVALCKDGDETEWIFTFSSVLLGRWLEEVLKLSRESTMASASCLRSTTRQTTTLSDNFSDLFSTDGVISSWVPSSKSLLPDVLLLSQIRLQIELRIVLKLSVEPFILKLDSVTLDLGSFLV